MPPGSYRTLAFIVWCLSTSFLSTSLGAQDSDGDHPYAGLSALAAKSKFQQWTTDQRIQHRQVMHSVSVELGKLAGQANLNGQSQATLERIGGFLDQASNLSAALEFTLLERQKLPADARDELDRTLSPLLDQLANYQQSKLAYQKSLGRTLAERWNKLTLATKRCELNDYLSLSEERPTPLLRNSPINIIEFVPKPAMPPFNQYLVQKQQLLAELQANLKPRIESARSSAAEIADDETQLESSRRSAALIVDALTKPYGQPLRGIMLCMPHSSLPAPLRSEVTSLLDAYLKELNRAAPAHEKLLNELDSRIESNRQQRLDERRFSEQLAVDVYLDNIRQLVQPVRVLAKRSSRVKYYEDAQLIALRQLKDGFEYLVRFMTDDAQAWITLDRIQTQPNSQPRMMHHHQVPEDGPGMEVTEETNLLSGQVYAYSPAGWKPAIVVDESALGVIVHWQGSGEPVEFYFPRQHLRIMTSVE